MLSLASHGSSFLSSPLLHPGDKSSLIDLVKIADLHKIVAHFVNSNQQTSSLSILSSILTTRVVRPYMNTILLLEEQILRGEIGIEGSIPVSLIVSQVSVWEGVLKNVVRLLKTLENGPSSSVKDGKKRSREEMMDQWTASPLISLLQNMSNTLILSELLQEAISAISIIWLDSFTSFLIYGRLGKEPLVTLTPTLDPNSLSSSLPNYTFPPSSLPFLPSLSSSNTRTSLLSSLSTICTSLSILHSLPNGDSYGANQKHSLQLSRGLKHRLQSILEGCQGPGDQSFPSRISQIEGKLFCVFYI